MKKTIKFFLVAIAATAMMFSACKKEDETNEPEIPTPIVINDDDLEKFDISNSQFGVTKTTTSSISVEWKQDEVKFDSVKIELKKLVVVEKDSSFESVAKTTVKDDTKYTFENLESSQKFDIQFSFYSNKKICKRSYKAMAEDSDKMLCDGSFEKLEVYEVAGLKIAMYNHSFSQSKHNVEFNCYGVNMLSKTAENLIYTEVENVAYNYHLITNKEFEKLEIAAGVTEEELSNVVFGESYGLYADLYYLSTNIVYTYLNDDGSYCGRYLRHGIKRCKDNEITEVGDPILGYWSGLLFVQD